MNHGKYSTVYDEITFVALGYVHILLGDPCFPQAHVLDLSVGYAVASRWQPLCQNYDQYTRKCVNRKI